jgi:hypothetical protein
MANNNCEKCGLKFKTKKEWTGHSKHCVKNLLRAAGDNCACEKRKKTK